MLIFHHSEQWTAVVPKWLFTISNSPCLVQSLYQVINTANTYISWELFEGMKHIKSMEINYSGC